MEKLALPYGANMNDLERVLDFLRTRPTGATVAQAKRVLEKKLLHARKIAFYVWTAFVRVHEDKWRLTSRGSEYVHGDAEKKRQILCLVIRGYQPYHEILEWALHERKDVLTAEELRMKWATDYGAVISQDNQFRLQGAPVTMFSVCDHAGLGKSVVGRRGASSRLEINKPALEGYIGAQSESNDAAAPQRSSSKINPTEAYRRSTHSYLGRSDASDNTEFGFPLSNRQTISVILPDEIPPDDEDDIKLWLELMLRRRMKQRSGETGS